MELVFRTESNSYHKSNGELLKGANNNYVDEVTTVDSPVVIKGDLYVEGNICFRHNYLPVSDINQIQIKLNDMEGKINSLLGEYGIFNRMESQIISFETQNRELQDRLIKMEKLFKYVCDRFSIDMNDLSENIDQKIDVLNNRSSAEKRLDIVNMRA